MKHIIQKPFGISSLTLKILGVNIAAVVILGFGLLYVVQYQDSLVRSELDAIRAEAQLFAGALSESAVESPRERDLRRFDPRKFKFLNPRVAKRMLRRFGEAKNVRVQLYDLRGNVLADSYNLRGPGGLVQITRLDPPKVEENFDFGLSALGRKLLSFIPQRLDIKEAPPEIENLPGLNLALEGFASSRAWKNPTGEGILLTAAAPVQRVRQVVGMVYLSRPGDKIEAAVQNLQLDILKIFAGILAFTIIFSIYLSVSLASPLKRLSIAADLIRQSRGREIEMPDLTKRGDEIGTLSKALRDMTNNLRDRFDAIENFAADVAHELKNPLTSLRSAVETAARVKDKDAQAQLMDIILHDVERLDRLITDISKASRLDAALGKEALEKIDLSEVMDEIVRARKVLMDDKKINLTFEKPDSPVFIMGSKDMLLQVFDNLISNAYSFAPKDSEISMSITQDEEVWHIKIEDAGPGLPENKLKDVFDRFYSERPSGEAFGKHSGLGLSICKQIIDMHRGHIWAENKKSQDGEVIGAVFNITLPVV